ncbi:hypothetical protein [Levilactobacillus bambusae]|uniref:Uncharacterized protein n=1 Tax=Levilactobacillus bambusae TaxID=2024736 RepID=A0A2V1N0V3_9LACO|nr:hypothetical protein [Levilactobacillus bambusae]PWG00006.1 hypothetical protein DCM90_03445 [Levilactobacillus bambusae]
MKDQLELGDDEFSNMLLVLDQPVTEANHKDYKFENEEMQEIADDVWAMPAYMTPDDDFSMFFIFTKIMSGETVVAFSEGELVGTDFQLSEPMPTGEGLNRLNEEQPDRAKAVLHFLNQISKADEGSWRMISDEDLEDADDEN